MALPRLMHEEGPSSCVHCGAAVVPNLHECPVRLRDLLIKYIFMVGEAEGVDFVGPNPVLSTSELAVLVACSEEASQRALSYRALRGSQ